MNQERAFRFGRTQHLVGVVGQPATTSNRIGIIVLNAGLVHHIGPFRLHVELTRSLNACGFPTLRFDLSTLGDSNASAQSQSGTEQIRADVADATQLLCEQSGCSRVVLMGLCSGAEHAHIAACSNPDVAGAVFLDGYIYRTPGFFVRHYLPRVFNPARWLRFLSRQRHRKAVVDAAEFNVVYPPRAIVSRELGDMLNRGLKLFFIYSGGISEQFNHLCQFGECFRRVARHPATSVDFFASTDHTYILDRDRKQVINAIERWLQQNFPHS